MSALVQRNTLVGKKTVLCWRKSFVNVIDIDKKENRAQDNASGNSQRGQGRDWKTCRQLGSTGSSPVEKTQTSLRG